MQRPVQCMRRPVSQLHVPCYPPCLRQVWKCVLLSQPPPAPRVGVPKTSLAQGSDTGSAGGRDKRLLQDLRAAAEDVGVAAFGSRAHLEKQALASVRGSLLEPARKEHLGSKGPLSCCS